VTAPIVLRWPLLRVLEAATRSQFDLGRRPSADFFAAGRRGRPYAGRVNNVARVQERALAFHWRRRGSDNGAAEARVRTGVWENTTFRLILFTGCGGRDLPPFLLSSR
jgi:hypothetical protein